MPSGTVYKPDHPELDADFVEFSDSWSRAQVREAWAAWAAIPDSREGLSEEEAGALQERLLAALRPKLLRLHLTCEGAPPITDPADLTLARLDNLDERVYRWWINVWIVHLRALADLGEALGRALYASSAPSKPKAETAATKTTTTRPQHRKR